MFTLGVGMYNYICLKIKKNNNKKIKNCFKKTNKTLIKKPPNKFIFQRRTKKVFRGH